MGVLTAWESVGQDLKVGLRSLGRSPGYTVTSIVILALAIGANTAMFSVIKGVLLDPLPFRDGDELVEITESAPRANQPAVGVSIAEYRQFRERMASIRDLVEYHSMSFTLLKQGEPDRVDTGVVSANFFDMLGVTPLLGRTFVEGDDDLGAEAVLVLGHEYWQQKFGADPSVVGRVLEMNNRPHTIVGVLPPYPQFPRANDVYMPTSACPFRAAGERTMHENHRAFGALQVFGRLAADRTLSHATAEADAVAARFDEDHPNAYQQLGRLDAQALSVREALVQGARPMLLALVGATLLVLLIACANVANLSLARALRRSRELALRTALGAGRGRLVRQLVTESIMIALAGGVLGLLVATWTVSLLVGFVARFTPRTGEIAIDGGVLVFALLASVATGILFGVAPALAASRSLVDAIRDGGSQAGDSTRRQRVRGTLVVVQVAVSFVLLVGAALLLQSFYRLSIVPLGYSQERVTTAALNGNFTRVATPEDALRIRGAILERVRSTPGVISAALTNAVPQSDIQPGLQSIRIEGMPPDARRLEADANVTSDDYFRTLDIPLVAGRDFRAGDDAEAPRVAIVNQTMAQLWGGRDPVGSRFALAADEEPRWITVVGVVGDFRLYGVDRDIPPQYYLPFAQVPFGGFRLLVRSALSPSLLVPAVKEAVFAVDDQTPVEDVMTLEQLRRARLATPGLTAALLGLFAGVALFITLAGLAGVIATSVSQRTREFGVRMALGATRSSVLRLVMRQGLVLVGAGVAIGVGGAYLFGRLIARFLFATEPTEPVAYAAVAALFILAALVAAFGPARRATLTDPRIALTVE